MAEPKTKIPVEFVFTAEEEYDHPEAHFATGDSELDKRLVNDITRRLNDGDLSAWFCAKVACVGPDGFVGTDYLGACSYNSFDEFKRDTYYENMCDQAYADMLRNMRDAVKRGDAARAVLTKHGEAV